MRRRTRLRTWRASKIAVWCDAGEEEASCEEERRTTACRHTDEWLRSAVKQRWNVTLSR